jgi:hypothetical protein
MVIIIKVFPVIVSSGVIPVLKPTVPKAENTSKARAKKGLFSTIVITNITINIKQSEIKMIVRALRISVEGMRFPQKTTSLEPWSSALTTPIISAKVVILIPPPVEAGAAPINIKIKIKNREGVLKDSMGSTLKPAERGVAAVNRDLNILLPAEALPSVAGLLYSRNKIHRVPETRR